MAGRRNSQHAHSTPSVHGRRSSLYVCRVEFYFSVQCFSRELYFVFARLLSDLGISSRLSLSSNDPVS